MRLHLMITLNLLLVGLSVEAATTANTSDGKTVTLNDDGTWIIQDEKQQAPQEVLGDTLCVSLIETTEDAVTGKSYTSMTERIVVSQDGKEGLIYNLLKSPVRKNGIIWSVDVYGGSTCIDDDDKANILFTDGTRLELENDIAFNCDNDWTSYLGSTTGKALSMLSSKNIKVMRVWTRDSYVEQSPTPEQAAKLRLAFACLTRQ